MQYIQMNQQVVGQENCCNAVFRVFWYAFYKERIKKRNGRGNKMDRLKIVTWNIRQGGGKAIQQIVYSLLQHRPDMIVLTEYKENGAGNFLTSSLKREGWHYIQSSHPPGKENGVLILSVLPLQACEPPFSNGHGSQRWNEVYVPSLNLFILGVHVPNINETYNKYFFWEQIDQHAHKRRKNQAVITGDFNTARRDEKATAPLKYSNFIMNLIKNDWLDAWKQANLGELDYSWFSHKKNGFRLDYLFLSPSILNSLVTCRFSAYEREMNFSDHSLLLAELSCKGLKKG